MTNLSSYAHQIRERLRLSEVIGRDLKLTRKGNEFLGLCPFHQEKTPSFTVNDHKAFYHCFGCGTHGDVISYKMQKSNLDFPVAVRELAEQAGIAIHEDYSPPEVALDLYRVIEFCCEWFEDQLQRSSGEEARTYLAKRGIDKATQKHFRLGFASSSLQNSKLLYQSLLNKGFDKQLILQAGVISQSPDQSRLYDRFRSRLIFPILDLKGRAIAFGGRILTSNLNAPDVPKYLNSAESILFHKGELLYNYYYASSAITKEQPPVVVEGYFDVITLYQVGWKTAVAPLGTALTEAQMALLWRRHSHPLLCFDGDKAGWKASFKAAEKSLPLLGPNKSLKICSLPENEDPDSLIRKEGTKSLETVFAQALPLVDHLWQGMLKLNPPETLTSPEDKAAFKRQALELIKTITDPNLAHFYQLDFLGRLRQLWYHSSEIKRDKKVSSKVLSGAFPPYGERILKRPAKKSDLGHKILLATLINHPILLKEVAEQFVSLDFQEETWNDLKEFMLMHSGENLKQQLECSDFKPVLEKILDQDLFLHAPFASPGTETKEALERWQEIWHQTTWKQHLKEDLKQTQETIRQTFNPEAWEKMRALKQTLTPETLEL